MNRCSGHDLRLDGEAGPYADLSANAEGVDSLVTRCRLATRPNQLPVIACADPRRPSTRTGRPITVASQIEPAVVVSIGGREYLRRPASWTTARGDAPGSPSQIRDVPATGPSRSSARVVVEIGDEQDTRTGSGARELGPGRDLFDRPRRACPRTPCERFHSSRAPATSIVPSASRSATVVATTAASPRQCRRGSERPGLTIREHVQQCPTRRETAHRDRRPDRDRPTRTHAPAATPMNGSILRHVRSPLFRRTNGGPSTGPAITSMSPSISTSAAQTPKRSLETRRSSRMPCRSRPRSRPSRPAAAGAVRRCQPSRCPCGSRGSSRARRARGALARARRLPSSDRRRTAASRTETATRPWDRRAAGDSSRRRQTEPAQSSIVGKTVSNAVAASLPADSAA